MNRCSSPKENNSLSRERLPQPRLANYEGSAGHSTRWSGNKANRIAPSTVTDNLHTSWAPLPSAGIPFLSALFFFKFMPLFFPILILS